MTFSSDEIQIMERLRRREAQFARCRWLLLVLCVGMLIGATGSLILLYHFPTQDDSVRITLVAYLLPPINMFFLVGLFSLGGVISRWHGDPKTRLLLKVTDELQERSA